MDQSRGILQAWEIRLLLLTVADEFDGPLKRKLASTR